MYFVSRDVVGVSSVGVGLAAVGVALEVEEVVMGRVGGGRADEECSAKKCCAAGGSGIVYGLGGIRRDREADGLIVLL